jgi:hypothetical protein
MREPYEAIMNSDVNVFRALPKMVRFQYMLILSYLWSAVFTIWVGSAIALAPSVIGHTAIIAAIFFTADVFRRAQAQSRNHRDQMRNGRDGTVLYDDLWGAPYSIAGKQIKS